MKNIVLELRDVWKVYKMGLVEVPAIQGINIKVQKGDYLSIVGSSGSGKSTTLNMISAMDIPTNGAVFLDGEDITKLNESKLARIRGKKIGFVFQTFNLFPTLNVFENIALPMRIHEFSDFKIKKEVKNLIKLVGLDHREKHLPAQLSGGERQRVAIARALSTSPSIILADEPTGNLDSASSREIMNLFNNLNENHKKTVIIVTHEPDIAKCTKRKITLKDGKILLDEILTNK